MKLWLPENHLVWFVIGVVGMLDMSKYEAKIKTGGAGRAAFDPRMLLTLLVYAYAVGVRSSREIERLCASDVAFRVICALDVPDHVTIARFRQRHQGAVVDLFADVLRMCARAGLGRVGVVAVDGTKIAANASKEANRQESWLREQWAREEAERRVAEAEQTDAAEDAVFGEGRRGDDLPREWTDPRTRVTRIRQALADLDAEDKADAAEQAAARAKAKEYEQQAAGPAGESAAPARGGRPPGGVDPVVVARARYERERARAEQRRDEWKAREEAAAVEGRVLPGRAPLDPEQHTRVRGALARLADAIVQAKTAQPAGSVGQPVRRRNLSDPDSRLLKTRNGWIQGYNCQLAVCDDQLILAATATQSAGDVEQFEPLKTAAEAAVATMRQARPDLAPIGTLVADAGYLSQANLTSPGPDRLIAVGKRREVEYQARQTPSDGPPPQEASAQQAMAHRLRTPQDLATYRRRGVTVEPVNGHLKDRVGLRQFARRGLDAVNAELQFAASVANLLKLYRAAPTG